MPSGFPPLTRDMSHNLFSELKVLGCTFELKATLKELLVPVSLLIFRNHGCHRGVCFLCVLLTLLWPWVGLFFFFNLLGLVSTVVKRVKLFIPSFAFFTTTEHLGSFLQIFVVFHFSEKGLRLEISMKLSDHFRKFCQMQGGKGLLLDTGK